MADVASTSTIAGDGTGGAGGGGGCDSSSCTSSQHNAKDEEEEDAEGAAATSFAGSGDPVIVQLLPTSPGSDVTTHDTGSNEDDDGWSTFDESGSDDEETVASLNPLWQDLIATHLPGITRLHSGGSAGSWC